MKEPLFKKCQRIKLVLKKLDQRRRDVDKKEYDRIY